MRWSADLNVGNAYIDAQHELLVALINKLDAAIAAGRTRDQLVRVLHEIKKYAEYHFVSEENHMREIGYPGLAEHARIHSEMLIELSLRIGRVNAEWKAVRDVLDFLVAWLSGHVANEDRKFGHRHAIPA